MLKIKNKYPILVLVGAALWVGETWYFGWNDKPGSQVEKMLDIIAQGLIAWGIIGDICRNLRITKSEHHVFNTKKIVYQDLRRKGKIEVR